MDRDVLYSFITEQEEWLDDWLDTLGWTKESLRSEVSATLFSFLPVPQNMIIHRHSSAVLVH